MTSPDVDPYRSPRRFALWFPLRTDDVLYLRPRYLLDVPPAHAHNDLAPLSTNRFDGFVSRAGVVWGLRRVRAPLHGPSGPERLERWTTAHRLRPFAEFVPEVALYEGLRAPGAPSRTDGADPGDFVLAVGITSLSEMVSVWGWYEVPVPRNQTETTLNLPPGPEAPGGIPGVVLLRVGPAALRPLDGKDLAVVLDAADSVTWETLLGEAGPLWKPLKIVDRRASDAVDEVNQIALIPGTTASPQAYDPTPGVDPTAELDAGGGPRWWFVGANPGNAGRGPDPTVLVDRTRRRVMPLSEVESGRIVSARDASNGRWYVGEVV
jgi:hypothetical protein